MVINSSPSSSLVALHEACCALKSGDAKSAIVVGSNLLLASMDGAEESEAVSAVYIKTLPDAIRDGNPIRAIIRASSAGNIAVFHDQSSRAEAYEELIREAYDDAGLDPQSTLLVEVSECERNLSQDESRSILMCLILSAMLSTVRLMIRVKFLPSAIFLGVTVFMSARVHPALQA